MYVFLESPIIAESFRRRWIFKGIFCYFYRERNRVCTQRCMKRILFVPILLLLASCGAIRVNYDYDKETDFSDYTTYNYFSDMNTGLSEFDTKRLLNAMDIILKNKGLLFCDSSC